jgi:hypothetical protein
MGAAAYGQQASESTSVAADEALPAPVPLVDIATEAEAAAESIRDIRTDLSSDQSVAAVAQQLPAMTREIDGRLRESRRIVAQRPSIELLGSLEGEWRRLRRELYGLNRDLSSRIHELERSIVQLDDLAKPWDQTFAAAKESSVPPEVLARVENIVHEIRQARDAVEKQWGRALTMQTRVGMPGFASRKRSHIDRSDAHSIVFSCGRAHRPGISRSARATRKISHLKA